MIYEDFYQMKRKLIFVVQFCGEVQLWLSRFFVIVLELLDFWIFRKWEFERRRFSWANLELEKRRSFYATTDEGLISLIQKPWVQTSLPLLCKSKFSS